MIQQRIWNLHHSNLAISVAYYIVSRCVWPLFVTTIASVAGVSLTERNIWWSRSIKSEKQNVFLEPAAPELCKSTQIICIKFTHVLRYFNGWLSTIRRQNDHPYVSSISTTGWTIEKLRRRDCRQEHDLSYTLYLRFDLIFSFLVKS